MSSFVFILIFHNITPVHFILQNIPLKCLVALIKSYNKATANIITMFEQFNTYLVTPSNTYANKTYNGISLTSYSVYLIIILYKASLEQCWPSGIDP